MKNLKSFFLIALTLIFANAAFAQSRVNGKVVEIIDGKTVVIQMQNRTRLVAELQYIEVPETGQPLDQVSKEHLRGLVLDKVIEFRARGLRQTTTIGQIFLKGVDISQQMIRDGAAWYAILEKSGQDAAESEVYQSNEMQAKTEKRGVWAIENLKPSWEIRAEAEENRQRQERLAQKAAEKAAAETSFVAEMKQRKKPAATPQMSSESQFWATTADADIKLPANMKMVGGLMVGYESSIKLGIVATPLLKMDFADAGGKQAVGVQMAYLYYDGDDIKGRQNIYLVCLDSESRDFKFLKYNELVVTADDQKIVVGKAKRIARKNEYGVKEGLIYIVKKNDFTKIANAKNLKIKVGSYSRELGGELQMLLQNVLQASL